MWRKQSRPAKQYKALGTLKRWQLHENYHPLGDDQHDLDLPYNQHPAAHLLAGTQCSPLLLHPPDAIIR